MQDNTKRGERALFWMKAIFVIFILYFFWSSPVNAILSGASDSTMTASLLIRFILGAVFSLGMLYYRGKEVRTIHQGQSKWHDE